MVTDIYMPVLPAILPLLVVNNGYSYLAAGLLVTAYNVTSSFTQPVVGWMSDTKGFSVSISISLLVSAVFVSLMGIAQDYYYLIMIFAIIAALGHACFHPTALSLVNRLCQPENRGRITSFFVVGGNFGYALGPVLAGVLVFWLGLPGLLFLIFPAIFMVFALRFLLPGGITGAHASHPQQKVKTEAGQSKKPFVILMIASVLRAWAVFAAITFLPMYLVTLGYDLITANILMTLMLLSGVAGQVMGGYVSDWIGRKEFMILGFAIAIPFFYLFFLSSGAIAIIAVLLFGFFLWSTFAVAVAMSHELLPENVGLASGMMLGLAIGVGGLGVAVNGMIADNYSLAAALGTIPIPIIAAMLLMIILPYPWKSLKNHYAPKTSP
jgi:FSR family fosmidomycin resistance protein-like MFS transporter